jgi:hypothetical protein
LHRRVHEHGEAVTDAPDLDVLIERLRVTILSQEPEVAFPVGDLRLTGCVIGNVCIRYVLDVANHSVKYAGHFGVGLVVCRDDLTTGSVLTLFIRYLLDVLWELVDRQRWASVDGLPLDRAPRVASTSAGHCH